MIEAIVVFHAHSNNSDGRDSPKTLIRFAARYSFKIGFGRPYPMYPGISDHNSVAGVKSLFKETYRLNNEQGTLMVPVMAAEVKFPLGDAACDVLFVKPGELYSDHPDKDTLNWLGKLCDRPDRPIFSTIQTAISEFGLQVIIPHSGAPFIDSLPLEDLSLMIQKLGKLRSNLGVEVINWTERLLDPLDNERLERETARRIIADNFGLAKFDQPDAHTFNLLFAQTTIMGVETLTAQGFSDAFRNGRTRPGPQAPLTPGNWAYLASPFILSSVRDRLVLPAKSFLLHPFNGERSEKHN